MQRLTLQQWACVNWHAFKFEVANECLNMLDEHPLGLPVGLFIFGLVLGAIIGIIVCVHVLVG